VKTGEPLSSREHGTKSKRPCKSKPGKRKEPKRKGERRSKGASDDGRRLRRKEAREGAVRPGETCKGRKNHGRPNIEGKAKGKGRKNMRHREIKEDYRKGERGGHSCEKGKWELSLRSRTSEGSVRVLGGAKIRAN